MQVEKTIAAPWRSTGSDESLDLNVYILSWLASWFCRSKCLETIMHELHGMISTASDMELPVHVWTLQSLAVFSYNFGYRC
jgi:hypothetical protein